MVEPSRQAVKAIPPLAELTYRFDGLKGIGGIGGASRFGRWSFGVFRTHLRHEVDFPWILSYPCKKTYQVVPGPEARAAPRAVGGSATEDGCKIHSSLLAQYSAVQIMETTPSTKQQLLIAATSLLARENPSAVTLRAAGNKVGASRTAPYRRFKDKRDRLEAVARNSFNEVSEILADATRRTNSPFAALRTRGPRVLRSHPSKPAAASAALRKQRARRAPSRGAARIRIGQGSGPRRPESRRASRWRSDGNIRADLRHDPWARGAGAAGGPENRIGP